MFVPPDPETLLEIAAARGVRATLHRAVRPMPTVEEAAAALAIRPDEMTKNLVFLIAGEPTLVIARGQARVERRRLAAHFGVGRKQVKLATPEQTREISGFEAGCVPSFGHRQPLRTLVEPAVLELPRVYGGTSDPQVLLSLAPADLLALTGATLL